MPNQWIEVDVDALASNIGAFRRHLDGAAALAPVVKSNGYGHGLELAAAAFARGGAEMLCTHSLVEAQRVAQLDLGLPVLILGPLASSEVADAVASGFHVTAYDPRRLEELAAAAAACGQPARVHLKLEVGTYRQGVDAPELPACLEVFSARPQLEFAGVHSHFANIEDTTDHGYARDQVARFEAMLRTVTAAGLRPQRRHLACSAAAAVLPESTAFDLVRLGISAYGYWSSGETLVSARQRGGDLRLRPALTWKVSVAQVKDIPAGAYVGYGGTWKSEVPSRLAVLPVGYADGYRRAFSGRAHVLLNGRRCPVRGRICMNLVMVDVTHLPQVAVGDEVVLLGRQGSEEIAAETLAGWADTIHYEILAGLAEALPRRMALPSPALAAASARPRPPS